jgi:hypothetical protein
LTNKDENTEINKEDSLNGSEKKTPAKRGRPRKIKEEHSKEDFPEINEGTEPDIEENTDIPSEENMNTEEHTESIPEEQSNASEEQNVNSPDEEKEGTEENAVPESEIPSEIKDIKSQSEENIKEEVDTSEVKGEENPEEQPIGIVPVPEESIIEESAGTIPEVKITRKSNYQISLADENHLRAKVLTGKLVSIDCYVKDKYSYAEGSGESQTNKISIHPKEKPHEIEIMVSIGTVPILENEITEEGNGNIDSGKTEEDSNYQVSLIDENLLRVLIVTEKSVSIDCSVKDDFVHTDGSNETHANKIFIHPKEKPQEVEIIVSIGSERNILSMEESSAIPAEEKIISSSQKSKLTPNPLVANLIQKFNDSPSDKGDDFAKTPEERLEEKLGPKNPWRIYKELMHRNLMVGLVGSVLIYVISIISFYSVASKKSGNADVVDAPRLIVMQDLPENQFQQQNVQDPNKPPEEEKPATDDGTNTNKIPPIVPKKIKPPRVIGPPRQKVDTNTTAIDKELDSLRKIHNNNITSNNGNNKGDTNKRITGNYPIPDSIMKGLKDNEVGLIGRFPPYWKQIDSREVDINKKEFTGVILVDTSVKKKEEALNMSVQIDKNNEYWKQYNFKNVFVEDSLKNVIYNIEPKQEGDQTYYRFYISGMAYNIYIAAFINNEHFEKHKAEIEQVVKTIRIQKPATPPGK